MEIQTTGREQQQHQPATCEELRTKKPGRLTLPVLCTRCTFYSILYVLAVLSIVLILYVLALLYIVPGIIYYLVSHTVSYSMRGFEYSFLSFCVRATAAVLQQR